jgi:CheY-like chemotaxis protein
MENNPDLDLILMDVYMPGMDGFEATRRIRQINKEVIIFVMTATVLSELIEEFAGIVVNDYFLKPFSLAYLDQLIQKHLKNNLKLGNSKPSDIAID